MAEWPLFARVCMWFTYAQIAACLLTHLCCTIGPRFPDPDPKEISVFDSVRYVLVPVFVLEVFAMLIEMCRKNPRPNARIMSGIVIWEMCVKMTYYSVLTNFNGGIVHLNLRAMGEPRPIYLARWIGWSFALPGLLVMANQPAMDDVPFPTFLHRIFPMLAATWAYCWSCYLGCVVYNMWIGWFLISLGFVGYIATIADLTWFFDERFDITPNSNLKAFVTIVREAIFVAYSLIWLLGNWDYLDSYRCQIFYSYCDVTLGCMFAILLHVLRFLPRFTTDAKES